jgi:hypothetical protein
MHYLLLASPKFVVVEDKEDYSKQRDQWHCCRGSAQQDRGALSAAAHCQSSCSVYYMH